MLKGKRLFSFMKKLVIALSALLLASGQINAQSVIPNNGFETWYDGISEEPMNFQTSNNIYYLIDLIVNAFGGDQTTPAAVTKVSPGKSGSYAIKIANVLTIDNNDNSNNSISAGFFISAGLSVDLDLNDLNEGTGTAFTARPGSFTGHYKFNQGATGNGAKDTAIVQAWLTKWDATLAQRDTVGIAEFTTTTSASSFTAFSQNFIYTSTATPDTIRITAFACINEEPISSNTYLILDDLGSSATVNSTPNPIWANGHKTQIIPNPTQGEALIKHPPLNTVSYRILSLEGDVLEGENINDFEEITLHQHTYSPGIYLVQFLDQEQNIIHTERLVVQ
jgi:hypothetical protein